MQGSGRGHRTYSIRRLALVATAGGAVVGIAVIVALLWTGSLLRASTVSVERDAHNRAVADDLQLSLLRYQRLRNLYVITNEPGLDESAARLAEDMESQLADARELAGSGRERQLVSDVAVYLSSYMAQRKVIEAQQLPLPDVLARVRPALSRAIDSVNALGDFNDAELAETRRRAGEIRVLSGTVAVLAALVMVVGGLILVFGVRMYVLRPLLSLHEVMARLRAGEIGPRAGKFRLREISELGDGLNDMADSLERQREHQLAFLAGVAHDLRNPLFGLKLGIHLLGEDQPPSKRRQICARLERQTEQLTRMVGDLLDATRIEAGALEIRRELVDIRDIIDDMVRLYQPTSSDHHIDFERPEQPFWVVGDVLRLEQVISNLLSNALKFSPPGRGVTVAVSARPEWVDIAVTDYGVGIEDGDLAEIFTPFRRLHPDVASGAGLGLSVVRRIVAAHGGSITVTSQVGQGSTFRVHLPLATSHAVPSPSTVASQPRAEGQGISTPESAGASERELPKR